MEYLKLFAFYESRFYDKTYIEKLKSKFKIDGLLENTHYYVSDVSSDLASRENNPNLAIEFYESKGISFYEFYPLYSLSSYDPNNIDVRNQILLSYKQYNISSGYDIYVRPLKEAMYLKYNMGKYMINLWVKDHVLLIPNSKSTLKFILKNIFEVILQDSKMVKGDIPSIKKEELGKITLDEWNKPKGYYQKENLYPYNINKDTSFLFDMFISLEPELSDKLGAPNKQMYIEWGKRLKKYLPELSDILEYSIKNVKYTNLKSKDYWIFPCGSVVHATSILVVNKSSYLKPGAYYINTGDGSNFHPKSEDKYNICLYNSDISIVNTWIEKSSDIAEREFSNAYVGELSFLDTTIKTTFKKTPFVVKGEALEWISWKIENDTYYSSAQIGGTCTFQCILQALLLISIDKDIYEKFSTSLKDIRNDFVSGEIKTDNFWAIHAINTIYNKKHKLPIPKIKYIKDKDIPMAVSIETGKDLGIENLQNMTDYDTLTKYMKEHKRNFWTGYYSAIYVTKVCSNIVNNIIPSIKKREKKISNEEFDIWSDILSQNLYYTDPQYILPLLAHTMNEKAENRWLITEEYRDEYLSLPSDWNNIEDIVIKTIEPYRLSIDDMKWILFWRNLPTKIPKSIKNEDVFYTSLLLAPGYNFTNKTILVKDILEKNMEIPRFYIWKVSGFDFENKKDTIAEQKYGKFKNSRFAPTNIELINAIPIYDVENTLSYLKDNEKLIKLITRNGNFSYFSAVGPREKIYGDNIKLRDYWYDKFSFLSPYLYRVVGTVIFDFLITVIAASSIPNRINDLRSKYKVQPIEAYDPKDVFSVWLYHELFGLKWEVNREDIKTLDDNYLEDSTIKRYLRYIIKMTDINTEKINSELSKLALKYVNNNKKDFEFQARKLFYKNKRVYFSVKDGYLNTIYKQNYLFNTMFLFEDSIFIADHNIWIYSNYKLKDESGEYPIVIEDNRFTNWLMPLGLNFIVKKGNSYYLYSIFYEAPEYRSGGYFAISSLDTSSFSRTKSELMIAKFHPSGLFFMNITLEHVNYLTLYGLINNWPTLMYILPIYYTYSRRESNSLNISSFLENKIFDIAYNNFWANYISRTNIVDEGWFKDKYHIDYIPIINKKYEIDFDYIGKKVDFQKLYLETELEVEKYSNNYEPLFRISSSSKLLLLYHRLSLLYRLVDTKEHTPDTLTSLYSRSLGYYGERSTSYIIQEIKSCYLISWNQHKLFVSLSQPRIVQQAIMGVGKSSTIIPLLVMETVSGKLNMVQPTHLVNQAIESIYNIGLFYHKSQLSYGEREYPPSQLSINISDDNYIKDMILRDPTAFRDNNMILDEFDSMYNPLTSEYNIPEKYFGHPIAEEMIPLDKVNMVANKVLEQNNTRAIVIDSNTLKVFGNKKTLISKVKDINIIDRYMDALVNIVIKNKDTLDDSDLPSSLKKKLREDIEMVSKYLIYKKDYGFDFTKDSILSVPYRSLNTPSSGSEFSDVDVVILTTLFSIKYSGIQKQHIQALINSKLLNEDQLEDVKNNKIDDDVMDILYKVIIPFNIRYSKKKYNVSFIDIVDEVFAKKRYAFSGTLNISLPESKCPKFYYQNIQPWKGVGETQYQDYVLSEIIKSSEVIVSRNLIEIFKKRDFNCLMDPAVVFKDEENIDVAKKLAGTNKRGVYLDPKLDIPLVDGAPFNTTICQKEEDKCVFYYDQKHCVGIDLSQPKNMLGLCSVSDINTLTEISQAIFRMRKILLKTHKVIFAYIGDLKIENGLDLYNILKKNEDLSFGSKLKAQKFQELNLCKRATLNYVKESYLIESYYKPIDGPYLFWLKEGYTKELRLTGLKMMEESQLNISNQKQLEQSKEKQIQIIMERYDYSPCEDNDDEYPTFDFKNYWKSKYLKHIILSKDICGMFTGWFYGYPRESEICNVLVDGIDVYVVSTNELFHMKDNVIRKLRYIEDEDKFSLKQKYYAAKFIFGLRVTPVEQYIGFSFVMENLEEIKKTMSVLYDKYSVIIPTSWLKYYMYNMKDVILKDKSLTYGLDESEIDEILSITKKVYYMKKVDGKWTI